MATVYLGLGSNLGDRLAMLCAAVHALQERARIEVDFTSGIAPLFETSAKGGLDGQPDYYNSAIRITTSWEPTEILDAISTIEVQLGRSRTERWGPRLIDIDVLLFDDRIIDHENLVIPHPRLRERRFVLEPLSTIAPHVIHPRCGQTIAELADRARSEFRSDRTRQVAPACWWRSPADMGRPLSLPPGRERDREASTTP